MYIPHILGILPPTRARTREALRRRARASERAFEKTNALSKTEHTSLSACRTPPVEPSAPGYGYPVHVVRATVPSQMPLRGPESHSETISAPGQYETLERVVRPLRLAYSASGPPHRHTARRSTTGHTTTKSRTALHPRCRHEPRGCDLNSVNETEITTQQAVFDGEGNRLLPATGRGEGVRPRTPVQPQDVLVRKPGKSTLWSYQRTLLRPCRPLLLDPLSIDKYRPDSCCGQACSSLVTRS